MSCADGNPGDALALKQRLASHAIVLAQARRDARDAHKPRIDYLAPQCKADELVFLAFALLVGPLCVVDTIASAGTAILYTAPAKRAGDVTFVQNVPEHFVRLDGPPTTVDQLLAAATQAGPSLPAPGLAPRPRLAAPTAAATGKRRGRPRRDGPALPRPRLPDPPPELPTAPARSPGLHVDFDGGAGNNPGVGCSGSLLLLVRGGVCSVLG
jgi:hypothetical protein